MSRAAETRSVLLPGGYFDDQGGRHRDVELRALSGRDEELLADMSVPAVQLVTELLATTVSHIGPLPMSIEIARDLTVGDRLFMLLQLRTLSIGSRVQSVVSCPWFGCGSKIDIDFDIGDIPIKEAEGGPDFELDLPGSTSAPASTIRFRLPTGADQEHAAPWLVDNPARALTELLVRCVRSVDGRPAEVAWVESLGATEREQIEEAMADAAHGPAMRLEAGCPECARSFSLPFDVQDLFFGELHASTGLLYREVHYLAYHYHWSESEILDMSQDRRRTYIEVLAEEIERLNDALV